MIKFIALSIALLSLMLLSTSTMDAQEEPTDASRFQKATSLWIDCEGYSATIAQLKAQPMPPEYAQTQSESVWNFHVWNELRSVYEKIEWFRGRLQTTTKDKRVTNAEWTQIRADLRELEKSTLVVPKTASGPLLASYQKANTAMKALVDNENIPK